MARKTQIIVTVPKEIRIDLFGKAREINQPVARFVGNLLKQKLQRIPSDLCSRPTGDKATITVSVDAITMDKARRQAKARGVSVREFLEVLLVSEDAAKE